MFHYSDKRSGGALLIDASAGRRYATVEESDALRDGYPDMNSGSLYLASMGVRKGERHAWKRMDMFDDRWKNRRVTSFMIYIIPTPVFAVG